MEVDSGKEHGKKIHYRRAGMKMWQYIAAGHLMKQVEYVGTLRMETQQIINHKKILNKIKIKMLL